MINHLGVSYEGLNFALQIKDSYRRHEPLMAPGASSSDRILIPEHLLNTDLALSEYEDPIALAVIAAKDPESPMALAAAVRLGRRGREHGLAGGIFEVVGDTSKHEMVRDCVSLVTREAFSPEAIAEIRHRASHHIFQTREQYRAAMTNNLRALLDGAMTPRDFLDEFIELAHFGNLRLDIYKRLIVKLMRSDAVRPCLKFMILERLDQFPKMVQLQIVTAVNAAPNTPEYETLKRELRVIFEFRAQQAAVQEAANRAGATDFRGAAAVGWLQ